MMLFLTGVPLARVADGREVEAETLSLEPLVFAIPGFLSAAEADELVRGSRGVTG